MSRRKIKTKRLPVNKKQVLDNSDHSEVDSIESDELMNSVDNLSKTNSDPSSDYPNRPVNDEIMKNKGLVKYRHKRERNPRVHLRYKFRKAAIRYRSRVAPVRTEDKPYAGELRGIRVNLVRSHKFKS